MTKVEFINSVQGYNFTGDLGGYTFVNSGMGQGGWNETNTGSFIHVGGNINVGLRPSVNDWVIGSAYNDDIKGLTGNDELHGMGGNDKLVGGTGDDALFGGTGSDTLEGGAGADKMDGDSETGTDTGTSIDVVTYENSPIAIHMKLKEVDAEGFALVETATVGRTDEATGDRLKNIEVVQGSDHDDIMIGNSQANTFMGGLGNDTIKGGAGDDTLYGYGLKYTPDVFFDNNTMEGGAGNDTLFGGYGNDYMSGGTGNDNVFGREGNDTFIWNLGDGLDKFVEVAGEGTQDILGIVGITSLFIERDGNHLRIGDGAGQWAYVWEWWGGNANGIDFINIGNRNYTTANIAGMATTLASSRSSSDEAPGSTAIDFSQIDISGVPYDMSNTVLA